jgi:large subunit ribosomal protein L25
MRKAGSVPAVLYGHGGPVVSLTVPAEQLDGAIRHGSRVVQLEGAVKEGALIREIQWNTWGTEALHVDFTRVALDELVQVALALDLRGEAPGIKEGGVVDHHLHEAEFECKAVNVPEKIEVTINSLKLNDAIKIGDLELPAGVTCLTDPEELVVQCIEPVEVPEEVAEAGEEEPEVIGGRKEEDEEGNKE